MPDTLANQVHRTLVAGIAPDVLPESEEESRLIACRDACRRGNPFPLMALQWPSLIVTDEAESQYFEGEIGSEVNPCLRLDRWQRMIALAFFDDTIREIYIKGCTGAGKGGIVAICCNLLYDVSEILRLNFTGPKFDHTLKGIFGETMDWRKMMRHPAPSGDAATQIASSARHYISIQNPQKGQGGEAFSGTHSRDPRGTWAVFDEATSSEDTWIENAEKNAYKIVCLANPRTIMGAFRNAFKPLGDDDRQNRSGVCLGKLGKRLCVTVGGDDCLNVRHKRLKTPVAPPSGITIGDREYHPGERLAEDDFEQVKALIPGQMDLTQFQAACSAKEPWKVRCFAHGMFPDEDPEMQVILSSWLPRHTATWTAAVNGPGVPCNAFGLDVAHSLTGDASSLAAGSSAGCAGVERWQFDNYPDIARETLKVASEKYGIDLRAGDVPVCIDYGGGYGAGVGDWLSEAGVWVIQSIPGGRAIVLPQVYQDIRTEMYALLGRRLDPTDQWADDPWAIPDDTELHEDLIHALRKWNQDFTKYRLVSKQEIHASLGRSPDKGDALALLFMAVRMLTGMDEWFAMTSGELLTYPSRPVDENAGAGEPTAPSSPPPSPRNPQRQIEDIFNWAKNRNRE